MINHDRQQCYDEDFVCQNICKWQQWCSHPNQQVCGCLKWEQSPAGSPACCDCKYDPGTHSGLSLSTERPSKRSCHSQLKGALMYLHVGESVLSQSSLLTTDRPLFNHFDGPDNIRGELPMPFCPGFSSATFQVYSSKLNQSFEQFRQM